MNLQMTLSLLGISMLVAGGVAGCDRPNRAETAGRKIDRATDQAGQKMGDAAEKVADKVSEGGAKAGVVMDDTAITAKVKGAIFGEPGLRTLQISVDTVGGVVVLTGSVDSHASRDRAGELAAVVAGVKRVENRLEVKSSR